MERRSIEELNVLDNFMFNELAMQEDRESAKTFFRIMLETIFQKKVRNLEIIPQRMVQGITNSTHGVQMDAYVEAYMEEDGSSGIDVTIRPEVFDFEPNLYPTDCEERRLRFYRALIDARILKSGVRYENMKDVTMIMISNYDPFGYDRMLYTIANCCKEEPDMPYDDGVQTLYLYTNGKKDIPSQALSDMLKFMADSKSSNIVNYDLRQISDMMDRIKRDAGIGERYMQSWELEQIRFDEGREAGRVEGRAEATKQFIERMLKSGNAIEQIAEICGCDSEEILKIKNTLDFKK